MQQLIPKTSSHLVKASMLVPIPLEATNASLSIEDDTIDEAKFEFV